MRYLGPPFDRISGGEAIELLAQHGDPTAYSNLATGVPLTKYRDCNFSFSGFKNFTNIITKMERDLPDLPPDQPIPQIYDLAASLQYMITVHILKRLHRAITFIELSNLPDQPLDSIDLLQSLSTNTFDWREDLNLNINVVVSGGVACSDYITNKIEKFAENCDTIHKSTEVRVIVPRPKKLCTDNGIMIAWNGMLKLLSKDAEMTGDILTKEADIEMLTIDNKAKLGLDISTLVSKANIKSQKIKRAVFA